MMFKVPVRGIGRIHMQLNAGLEYLDGLLPVEVVVTNEGSHAPFEIMKPVLMMIAVTAILLVKVPILCQFPDIIVIRSIVWS
jgi:hypothetical protein